MQRELGSKFYYDGKYYEVVRGNAESCNGCAFVQLPFCWKVMGLCNKFARSDSSSVMAKEIGK